MKLGLRPTNKLQTKQIQKLTLKIKLSNFIKLPENKFAEMIKNTESEPLFERLMYSENRDERIISYKRFPRTVLSGNFYELKEGITADSSSFDVEFLLKTKNEIIQLIKQLGLEKFKKYFLYNEDNLCLREISLRCKLSIHEAERINELIDEISIHGEFYNPSTIDFSSQIHYTRVASIDMKNESAINLFSPHLARGKYVINYEKLEDIKRRNVFSKDEIKKTNGLIKKLELINIKKSIIYQIIKNILERQLVYFKSNDLKDLGPFSQKELAQRMGVDESLISRAIYGRSIVTPEGEEEPIKFFLPSKKEIRKNLIKEIIATESISLTDDDIRCKLNEMFKIKISRRSVADCRKELKIPSVFKRKDN